MDLEEQKIIHFVCSGNVFRSRLAEGYFNSSSPDDWTASSSGIYADGGYYGDITPWAEILAEENDIRDLMSETWSQTTCKILRKATLVVFMNQQHEDWAKETCDITRIHYMTLDVEDMVGPGLTEQFKNDKKRMRRERGDEMDRINNKIKSYIESIVNSINNDTLLQ